MQFSVAEGRLLHGLVAGGAGDIVLRLDHAGFIIHASPNAAELGTDLSALLLKPHIAELAAHDYRAPLLGFLEAVLAGETQCKSIEFPILTCERDLTDQEACEHSDCRRWYALSLKRIAPQDAEDHADGCTMGLLRCVQHKHALQREINASSLTDPVTGLANRHALCAQLQRALNGGQPHILAILAVDRLRAIFMQYGQNTADEILWGFARFLETMALPGQEPAQLDGERVAVVLPGMSMQEARIWARDVVSTFAGLTDSARARAPELTASAGLARVEKTVDWTLRQAELGLVMARAGGGTKIGICRQPAVGIANGEPLERAMDAALQRTARRNG